MAISREHADELSLATVRVVKLLHALRQHAPRVHPSLDHSSYPVVFSLAAGPRRVSDVAESCLSDVSTVSRTVTTLVQCGIAHKVADPNDRRVQMVELTEEGKRAIDAIKASRAQWFQHILADWHEADAEALSTLLQRFVRDLDAERERVAAAAGIPLDQLPMHPRSTHHGTP